MNDSEQKASTQDPKFMTITKFAWDGKAQQVKTLEAKVEEMQAERAALIKHLRELQEKWTDSLVTYERSIASTCATIADDLDNGNFHYLGMQALKGDTQ